MDERGERQGRGGMDRRLMLKLGAAALGALAIPGPGLLGSATASGGVKRVKLTAGVSESGLGRGPRFQAWLYNGQLPGPVIRVREGDTLEVSLVNLLPEPTTIHWHGVPVPNAMDGVPGVTQEAVPPGGSFTYRFIAQPAGTYIYHSHQSLQLDRGLYGALVIEPRHEKNPPDREYVLTLEDWATVNGGGPDAPRRRPAGMMGRGMMGRGGMGRRGGGPQTEPVYDAYAVNGRAYPAGPELMVKKGERVRLRLTNPSAVTIYDIALGGHTLRLTQLDANPVDPVEVDAVRLAPGERADVEFTADNPGRWLLQARETGWGEGGLKAELAYQGVGPGEPAPPVFGPTTRWAGYMDLRSALAVPLDGGPTRQVRQVLSGGMHSPYWTINGRVYPDSEVLRVGQGERMRLAYFNHSPMPHPMHLHGQFFRVVNPNLPPERWLVKDTALVYPMQGLEVDFLAHNPGAWFHHCHNLYHMEAGMANVVEVAPRSS